MDPLMSDSLVQETLEVSAMAESAPAVVYTRYRTPSGVVVEARRERLGDARRGSAMLATIAECVVRSGFEFPGGYTRGDVGLVDPSLVFEANGTQVTLRAANARGLALLPTLADAVGGSHAVARHTLYCDRVVAALVVGERGLAEEERPRGPSVVAILHALRDAMTITRHDTTGAEGDVQGVDPSELHPEPIGFYGTFDDELVFGIEELEARLARDPAARDVVLVFADDVVLVDHARDEATRHTYELTIGAIGTRSLPRAPLECREPGPSPEAACLAITTRSDPGMGMAIEHRARPISAVQFRPEEHGARAGQLASAASSSGITTSS